MQEAMQVEFVESSLEATVQHPKGADGELLGRWFLQQSWKVFTMFMESTH